MANSWVLRESRRFEPRIRQFVNEGLGRNTVLEADGDRECQAVHEAGECGAVLRYLDEDLARRSLRLHADDDVAFVNADRKFVGYGLPLIGKLAPPGTNGLATRFEGLGS